MGKRFLTWGTSNWRDLGEKCEFDHKTCTAGLAVEFWDFVCLTTDFLYFRKKWKSSRKMLIWWQELHHWTPHRILEFHLFDHDFCFFRPKTWKISTKHIHLTPRIASLDSSFDSGTSIFWPQIFIIFRTKKWKNRFCGNGRPGVVGVGSSWRADYALSRFRQLETVILDIG